MVDLDATALKTITTAIEDENRLGRLYDMDVLDGNLNKLDRCLVGGKSRDCIVCGAPGRGCASRRLHSVSELQTAVNRILTAHFQEEDAREIGNLAVQPLLEEVATTPKPGPVDRRNTGSHRDMDMDTFQKSAHALTDYFCGCVRIGMQTNHAVGEDTFYALRRLGLQAEQDMYRATGGVNTHKGAIFTIGILCGAVGRLWNPQGEYAEADLLAEVSAMTTAPWKKTSGSKPLPPPECGLCGKRHPRNPGRNCSGPSLRPGLRFACLSAVSGTGAGFQYGRCGHPAESDCCCGRYQYDKTGRHGACHGCQPQNRPAADTAQNPGDFGNRGVG